LVDLLLLGCNALWRFGGLGWGWHPFTIVAPMFVLFFMLLAIIGVRAGYRRRLEVTLNGRQWIANLYSNVFRAEHVSLRYP
jgi:hypothetical protein